jgi:superfamily II DNA or RNA helicase
MELYLQKIVEYLNQDNIPADWLEVDFKRFSKEKSLFDYQQKALENSLKALYLYYEEFKGNKSDFYKHYQNNGLSEDLSYNVKKESKTIKYLLEYDKDFPVIDDKISFEHFINRMSFWMATGSGKTLIIVKLIELLYYLMENNKIPKKDILFLTYRDDLLEQFQKHVSEFNSASHDIFINLIDLKLYDETKHNSTLKFANNIDVYYYRSDLISDKQKDKIINYKNYDNNGNWYIILDEAHKGDREDSKRQIFYSILSRNGFMFNFSATFTDERDYATCVYNFNLEKFIQEDYGKHIYVSKENIKALENKDTTSETEKQKILLKIFILLAAINKKYEEIRKISDFLYHKPLLLTLVNSVNTEDSDLELFFKEIEKISAGKGNNEILEIAKSEIIKELSSEEAKLEFEEKHVNYKTVEETIKNLTYTDILNHVFNSQTTGKIEVLKIPSNKQELIFKLATSDRPFALMKIGDITEWIKNKLSNYEIIEKFENESFFKNINNNKDISILMGSRSFYEGWDSNRPNIILFINIGKGTDAKKFVLQSIGRGVRIEPLPNKRRRAIRLYNNQEISRELFEKIKEHIEPLETLFVFGTKAENLKEVLNTLKQEKTEELLGDLFEINPNIKDKELLIPVYIDSENIIAEEEDIIKYRINPEDYEMVKNYFNYIGDKILLCKFNFDIRVLNKIKEAFNGQKNKYFIETNEQPKINNPEFLLQSIFKHFSNKTKEFKTFKKLENEIIHFKRITITVDKLNSLKEKIEKVKKSKDKEQLKKELKEKLAKQEIDIDEYTAQLEKLSTDIVKEVESTYSANERLKIKYIANHYYIPVVLSESEKIDFIKHIIKYKSEIEFINKLEEYLQKEGNLFNDNLFKQCDWWFFSKIDETLDEVYIPYYNPKTNRIDKFKPDFIFWLKKGNEYTILFVDPKGTEHIDGYRKIDGFKTTFSKPKYEYDNLNITVKLLLYTSDIRKAEEEYRDFWFDNLSEMLEKLSHC